jgi:hypothetical protein
MAAAMALTGSLFLALTIGPENAHAAGGTYTVTACDPATGFANNSWDAGRNNDRLAVYTVCPNDGEGRRAGLRTIADINVGSVPFLSFAWYRFDAPPGTGIASADLSYTGYADSFSNGWGAALQADDSFNLDGCFAGSPGTFCTGFGDGSVVHFDLGNRASLRTLIGCGSLSGCNTADMGAWPYARSHLTLHSAAVHLRDHWDPVVKDLGGSLTSGGWKRGVVHATYNADDNTGIKRSRMRIEGGGHETTERGCDYTHRVPCSNQPGAAYGLDTRALPDGRHRFFIDVWDAAENNAHVWRDFDVDNNAPTKVSDANIAVGQGWQPNPSSDHTWTPPGGQHSPIVKAYVRICKEGGECRTEEHGIRDHIDRTTISAFDGPGEYRVQSWLEDDAGNYDSGYSSDTVRLRFDNVPPGPADPAYSNGWLNKEEAESYRQSVKLRDSAFRPVSGIAGYSVTTDGSTPDGSIDVAGDEVDFPLTDLPEGRNVIKATAVSGAGIASPAPEVAEVLVDKTAPVASLAGAPAEQTWSRESVTLSLQGEDQLHLSGMGGAPAEEPDDTKGAYLAFRLDGGEEQRVRGAVATIPVTSDGEHTITYRAVDLAGNESPEETRRFKIDATPPEGVVFEQQSLPDPTRISVSASDRTSGLGDGQIQMRRVGEVPSQRTRAADADEWMNLDTSRDGSRYSARVPWLDVDRGVYEFRAHVEDQAGNEATENADREGRQVRWVIIPGERIHEYIRLEDGTWVRVEDYLRDSSSRGSSVFDGAGEDIGTIDTRVTVGIVRRVRTAPSPSAIRRCRRLRSRAARRRCQRRGGRFTEQLAASAKVGFGKKAKVRGTLTTADGSPIAGASVDVYSTPKLAGGTPQKIAEATTTNAGGFAYRTRRGPSRVLTFAFDDGPGDYRRSHNEVTLRVKAAATFHANRRSLRNGQRVLFTGRVRGTPLPPRGKVVDLQAFYRGRWRTFATPRANNKGKFRFRYRFEATRGVVTYRFRAKVRAEGAYPYELGYSRTVKVTVRG